MTLKQYELKKLSIQNMYNQGWITLEEYEEKMAVLEAQYEYENEKAAKYQDYKAGKITNYAYIQWKKKNDPSLNGGAAGASAAAGSKAGAGSVPAAGAPDPGQKAADKALDEIEKRLKKTYNQAFKEISEKLGEWSKKFADKDAEMQEKVANGQITQAQYQKWQQEQVFIGDLWSKKMDQISGVLLNANQEAMELINGQKMGVFAENANWQSYKLTQDTGMNLSFAVYDVDAVGRLIKDRPELLPRKEVNGKKDKAWNVAKISNCVAQGIILGESIPKIAKRIASETASQNGSAMVRYARTAMTSAQNAGRMETLHRAQGMGIQCKKVWLSTLDRRTRDAHAKLDGQTVGVDEAFQSDFGPILYPGDVGSKGSVPANLYNCRCTLTYEYDGYPADPTNNDRIQYNEYYTTETDASGKKHKVFHRESSLVTDMTFGEWKAAKEGSALNDLNVAKVALAEAQKKVVKIKQDKVYSNIWKDDVTLADYAAKKGSIQAKRDYYVAEIDKLQNAIAEGKSWATPEKLKAMQKQLKLLNEFDLNGKIIEARDKALAELQAVYDKVGYGKAATAPVVPGTLKKPAKTAAKAAAGAGATGAGTASEAGTGAQTGGKVSPFTPDAYANKRKDAALWAKSPKTADQHLRDESGRVWRSASAEEKDAAYEYTQSYHKFNEPLRGIEYGSSRYLGVGKTDLNAGSARNGNRLNKLTDIIDKSSYKEDIWLQRGCNYGGMDKFFNISPSLLRNGSQAELEKALLGTTPTEYAFMSCGSNKGAGLNVNQKGGVLLNVYCPAGTKMLYVEPFSAFGRGSGEHWDGKATQSSFGSEVETLLQQGTKFRVTKVERSGRDGKIYVDLEVISQDNQQRWKK